MDMLGGCVHHSWYAHVGWYGHVGWMHLSDMLGGYTCLMDAEDASSKVSKDKLQLVLREFELNDNVDMVQPPRHLSPSLLV